MHEVFQNGSKANARWNNGSVRAFEQELSSVDSVKSIGAFDTRNGILDEETSV
jgi:hypothetical protein